MAEEMECPQCNYDMEEDIKVFKCRNNHCGFEYAKKFPPLYYPSDTQEPPKDWEYLYTYIQELPDEEE